MTLIRRAICRLLGHTEPMLAGLIPAYYCSRCYGFVSELSGGYKIEYRYGQVKR